MITLIRTNSLDTDFRKLVVLLDEDLAIRDGEEHSFYAQYNKIIHINYVVVAYEKEEAVGCGAFKEYEAGVAEIKRMFVHPLHRKKGVATHILTELEKWATELHYTSCVLETGKKQPEAIHLYKKSGYFIIPNYGQYAEVENSVCMKKTIHL